LYKGKPTGSLGDIGIFSFNGNKIITSGGGGALVSLNDNLMIKAKHLTTTAKIPHAFEYIHDEIGYNFRMPNLNAALACAQLESLNLFLSNKRILAEEYNDFCIKNGIKFRNETIDTKANYWLMCIEMENRKERDLFLNETKNKNIMTRPIWQLLFRSKIYENCQRDSQMNAIYLEDRIVNIPSSVRY
jgi:dTDP-4-amino-4,6-dideoxygalactose transaminase